LHIIMFSLLVSIDYNSNCIYIYKPFRLDTQFD
jgi:hypothetical protein